MGRGFHLIALGLLSALLLQTPLLEQNAHLALQISDRAYVLQTGRVAREGASRDLLGDPFVRTAYLGL